MVRIIVVYLFVAVFSVVEGAIMNTEFIPACMLVSTFLIPSILVFAFVERFRNGWRPAKHIVFVASVLPLSGMLLRGSIVGPEGKEVSRIFLFWYLSQGLVAYLLLLCTRRRG